MPFVSYAQNFEDVILDRALKDVPAGFYIDVGAQDPIEFSVTKAFYEKGWRGINIEPVEEWYRKLLEDRPEDINLNLAVSDRAGDIKLFEIRNTGLSTYSEDHARKAGEKGYHVKERRVQARRLNAICREHKVRDVHFLKIDVEGAEEQVLRSFAFRAVRPWIVLVEATEPNSTIKNYANWEPYLLQRDYQFVYFDGLNRFYLAKEHSDLESAFIAPPNVFDEFITYPESRARTEIPALNNDLLQVQEQLEQSRSDVARLEQAMEQEVAAIRAERDVWFTHANEAEHALHSMRHSRSWRITAPLRAAMSGVRRLGRGGRRGALWTARFPKSAAEAGIRLAIRFVRLHYWGKKFIGRPLSRFPWLEYRLRTFALRIIANGDSRSRPGSALIDVPPHLSGSAKRILSEMRRARESQIAS